MRPYILGYTCLNDVTMRDVQEQPLTYLVLDEFHSYDGAQGTDVAMLLRRLGHRLGTATAASPLTGIACVGTSATLGSSSTAVADMCNFASRVFGNALRCISGDRRTKAVCGRRRAAISTSPCRFHRLMTLWRSTPSISTVLLRLSPVWGSTMPNWSATGSSVIG